MSTKNPKKLFLAGLFSVLAALALSGCSLTGTASSKIYTVTYYDDSSTPIAVGYDYVRYGKQAVFTDNSGSTYDYRPNASTPPDDGHYYAFKDFEGTYAESSSSAVVDSQTPPNVGEAVNLGYIKGNCDVYAKFTSEAYSYELHYLSDGSTYKNSSGLSYDVSKDCGSRPISADLPSADPSDPEAKYYTDSSFLGWYIQGDAAKTLWTDASLAAASWLSGQGAPSGAPVSAVSLYADLSVKDDDGFSCPDLYYYGGVSATSGGGATVSDQWIKVGAFDKEGGLRIDLVPLFAEPYVDFSVTILSAAGGTSLGSFPIAYDNEISLAYDASASSLAVAEIDADGIAHSLGALALTAPAAAEGKYYSLAGWAGVYPSIPHYDNVSGISVDLRHIRAACSLAPVWEERTTNCLVSFYNEGAAVGVDAPLDSVEVPYAGSVIYGQALPTRTSDPTLYSFVGWRDGGGHANDLSSIKANIDLFAYYAAKDVTLDGADYAYLVSAQAYAVTAYDGTEAAPIFASSIPTSYASLALPVTTLGYSLGAGTGTAVFSPASRFIVTSLSLPSSIVYFKENALSGMKALASFSAPSVLTLPTNAFNGCGSLTDLSFPSLVSIGDYAFYDCLSLVSLSLPDGVTSCGHQIVFHDVALTAISVKSAAAIASFPSDWNSISGTAVLTPTYRS